MLGRDSDGVPAVHIASSQWGGFYLGDCLGHCDACYDKASYPRRTHEGRAGGHAILSVRAGTRTVGRVLVD